MRRRRLLGLAAGAALAQGCRLLPTSAGGIDPDDLEGVAAALVDGGQYIDGIPSIDAPDYVTSGAQMMPSSFFAPRMGEYDDEDVVDGVVPADGTPRAYPRFITEWHEVVNDTFVGEPVSITYCPLTGSTLVYSGRLAGGTQTVFTTSGRLYNSNLVLADRDTLSFWPQLLGVAVSGDRRGERLRQLPIAVTTSWGRWKALYPTTLVLTTRTGRLRPYRSSPYGRDYPTDTTVLFPLTSRDGRYPPKRVVLGVRTPEGAVAIDKAAALERRLTTFELGGEAFVALFDEDLGVARVFRARLRETTLRFRQEGAAVVDEESRSRWSHMGVALAGPLVTQRLEAVPAPEVFWFAWYATYPRTLVVG
ncbi:MAG: DUF3179 domain-containing protein [Candidatus Limnocylindria bacterium]